MKKFLSLILAILGIFIAEISLLFNQVIGLILYVLLVGILLFSMDKDNKITKREKLLIFLMIVPILRICEFFFGFDNLWNSLIFYLLIIFLTLFYLLRFSLQGEYNLHKKSNFAAFLGGLILIILLRHFFGIGSESFLIFLVPLFAYSEEMLFREGIQNLIMDNYGAWSSIFFTSLLYTIFSLSYGLAVASFVFLSSLLICFVYKKTNRISLTIPINILIQILLITA